MAAVYTQVLGHVSREGVADVITWTVDPSQATIIRHISVTGVGSGPLLFSVYYLSGGLVYFVDRRHVQPDETVQVQLRQRLPDDAELHVSGDATLWSVLVTGYLLQNE